MATEKLLPQNLEAETGMLGSMLIDPDCVEDCLATCPPEDCYREANRAIYEAIKDLTDSGKPTDFITLTDELARRGKLDEIGGYSYVSSLANQVPTSANAVYYAEIVNRTARLRRLIAYAGQVAAVACNEPDADAAEQWAADHLAELTTGATTGSGDPSIADVARDFRADMAKWRATPFELRGISTGIKALDYKTRGARRGALWVVGARSSMGKTALSLTMLRQAAFDCANGHFVAMVSLEMSRDELFMRMAAMESGQSAVAILDGDPRVDWDAVDSAVSLLEQLPIRILDASSAANRANKSRGRVTPEEIRRRCQAWRRDNGVMDLLVVDYVELVSAPSGFEKMPREERLSEITKAMKALAEEMQTPVIALSQLNRGTEDGDSRIPTLANIRGSDAIGNDADVVIFPVRWDYYTERGQKVPDDVKDMPKGYTDLMVAKQRGGPVGLVSAFYLDAQMRFCDFDKMTRQPTDYQGKRIHVPQADEPRRQMRGA